MSEQPLRLADGSASVLETWGSGGPWILCIHGMTSSRKAWGRFAARFADRFRVAAYDQRGHGDAYQSHGSMKLDDSVADLQRVIRILGADVAALVGHSWGGAIAILGGRATTARSVVAVDPVLLVAPHTCRRDYLDDAEELFAKPPAQRETAVRETLSGWHATDVDAKLHAVARMTAEPIARLASDNGVDEGRWNIRGAVASYPKPLLIFAAGPEDSVMSPADVEFLRTSAGSNVRVAEFPSEGHNLHRTAFDAFAEEVARFLNEVNPQPAA